MKHIFILLFIFITSSVLGQELTINSKAFNQKRKIFVSLPEHYAKSPVSYPVIYILDGQVLFNFLKGLYQYNSDKYPPAILVGVIQVDRGHELVEHKDNIENQEIYNHFSDFFLNELIPYINSTYRTNSLDIFIGDSFGGVFLLNKMLEPTKVNNCICISPTVWVNHYKVLKKFKNFSPTINTRLYLGYGENDFKAIRNGVVKISEIIKTDSSKELTVVTNMYRDEDHNSAILIGMRKGLDYFFKDFIFPENKWNLMEKTGDDSIFFNYFKQLSASFGCVIVPGENDYNQLGYYYLEVGKIEDAIHVFSKNIKLHPYSSNTYDSFGDALTQKGNYKKALEYYRKAFNIEKKGDNNKFQLQQYQDHINQAKGKLRFNNNE